MSSKSTIEKNIERSFPTEVLDGPEPVARAVAEAQALAAAATLAKDKLRALRGKRREVAKEAARADAAALSEGKKLPASKVAKLDAEAAKLEADADEAERTAARAREAAKTAIVEQGENWAAQIQAERAEIAESAAQHLAAVKAASADAVRLRRLARWLWRVRRAAERGEGWSSYPAAPHRATVDGKEAAKLDALLAELERFVAAEDDPTPSDRLGGKPVRIASGRGVEE